MKEYVRQKIINNILKRDLKVCDKYEHLVAHGLVKFSDASVDDLSFFAKVIVSGYLIPAGVKWQLGDVRVGQSCIIKLQDDHIHYLDVLEDTKQFLWAIDNHRDSVHPDEALAYFLSKARPDLQVDSVVDDLSGLRRVIVTDPSSERSATMDDVVEDGVRKLVFRFSDEEIGWVNRVRQI